MYDINSKKNKSEMLFMETKCAFNKKYIFFNNIFCTSDKNIL